MDAGRPVAGIRISREAGTTVRSASYLPTDSAVFCRFLSSRKVTRQPAQSSEMATIKYGSCTLPVPVLAQGDAAACAEL